MAFELGTATDISDLVTKLFTFATANGWTQDQLNTGTGQAAMHRNSVFVSFRWSTTSPTFLGLYQALGYTGGNQPGQHPNDSGNGVVSGTNATIGTARSVDLKGNGPFNHYGFFEDDVYIHVVVESASAGIYRHFGFGELQKLGTFTGGEYLYGERMAVASPTNATNTALLDGLATSPLGYMATLHVEGLPGQGGTGKWGIVWGNNTGEGNDTAAVARVRIMGAFRSGPIPQGFGQISAGAQSGLIPMYPQLLLYRRASSLEVYPMGFQKDVRQVNIKNFAPKDEVTIGGDVWKFYPMSQKLSSGVGTDATRNSGIAYRKVA